MRMRKCKKCGKIFELPAGKDAYLCEECAKKSKINSVLRERTCKICGASFVGYPRSFFCPSCSAERKRQQKKIHNQRKPARPLGSADICQNCGKEYVVKSGRQKYCPECSEKIVLENIRAQKRKYALENSEKIKSLKQDTRGKRYICPICGKEFEKHTSVAACSEKCERELRRRRQNRADIKRGKRKIPANQRYNSGLPKSGVVGITYHRRSGKWQVKKKGKYIGLYSTLDQAKKALREDKIVVDIDVLKTKNYTDGKNLIEEMGYISTDVYDAHCQISDRVENEIFTLYDEDGETPMDHVIFSNYVNEIKTPDGYDYQSVKTEWNRI